MRALELQGRALGFLKQELEVRGTDAEPIRIVIRKSNVMSDADLELVGRWINGITSAYRRATRKRLCGANPAQPTSPGQGRGEPKTGDASTAPAVTRELRLLLHLEEG